MVGVNHKQETEGVVLLSPLNLDKVFRRKKDAGSPGLQGRKGLPGTEKAGRDGKESFTLGLVLFKSLSS